MSPQGLFASSSLFPLFQQQGNPSFPFVFLKTSVYHPAVRDALRDNTGSTRMTWVLKQWYSDMTFELFILGSVALDCFVHFGVSKIGPPPPGCLVPPIPIPPSPPFLSPTQVDTGEYRGQIVFGARSPTPPQRFSVPIVSGFRWDRDQGASKDGRWLCLFSSILCFSPFRGPFLLPRFN